jgi:hypothetical protein
MEYRATVVYMQWPVLHWTVCLATMHSPPLPGGLTRPRWPRIPIAIWQAQICFAGRRDCLRSVCKIKTANRCIQCIEMLFKQTVRQTLASVPGKATALVRNTALVYVQSS